MSLHINRFIDSVKAHEARNQRDFVMSLRDAKDLQSDITKLLLVITDLQQKLIEQQQTVQVKLEGSKF